MNTPLKLWWWKDEANFGDRISYDLVAEVSGRAVEWARPQQAELFAVGSIMKVVRRGTVGRPEGALKPWLWGTGCIGPQRIDFMDRVQLASLRGPLTAELLRTQTPSYGDPGLLADRLIEAPDRIHGRVGIVPHFSKLAQYSQLDLFDSERFCLIDVGAEDHLSVVRAIAECDVVFSSSLHGLIVADSFRVPNFWLRPDGNHAYARFKFYDYANSIGRPMRAPLAVEDIARCDELLEAASFAYLAALPEAKAAIAEAFPQELRA